MGFFFGRVKNWLGYENLTNSDLNAEINNIIAKAGADTISSANSTNGSAPTVPAMQTTESPGAVGTEVLAITTQEDVQQIRYQLNAILGGAQWYTAPVASLTTLNTSLSGLFTVPTSRIVSGRVDAKNQAMFLVPDGTAATINLEGASTNLQTYINSASVVFNTNLAVTSLQLAPSSNNTCLVNDVALTGAQATKIQGERGTVITIDNVGSSITSLNGTYAAFKTSTEYFVALVDTTNNQLRNCFRGVGFDSSDAWLSRVAISDDNTITLCKLTWVFATYDASTLAATITYDQPTIAYLAPTSPGIGDFWYDLTNSTWKKYSGVAWVATAAVFAGICIQDTTGCKAARSAHFFKVFNQLNTVELERVSNTVVRSTHAGQQVSVNGATYAFVNTVPTWDSGVAMDAGVTFSASTTYALYVTDLGDVKISDVYPSERKFDLLGGYHPAKPWRCVGECATDGSTHFTVTSLSISNHQAIGPVQRKNLDSTTTTSATDLSNAIVTASVGSNALTVSLKTKSGTDPSQSDPVSIGFRSSTLTSGAYVTEKATAATSVVVSSGSTLGHTDGADYPIFVYAIDNAGTIELAVSTSPADERYLQTTVAEGGAGAADSLSVLYSTTLRSSVAVRLLAVLKSTQTTAGTWAAVPTAISAPGNAALSQLPYRKSAAVAPVGGVGISASCSVYTDNSTTFKDITNLSVTLSTSGRPVRLMIIPDGTTDVSYWENTGGGTVTARFLRDSTDLGSFYGATIETATSIQHLDFPTAGTYVYKLQGKRTAGTALEMGNSKLVAYEI